MNKFFIGVLFILFTSHIISAQQGTQKFKQPFLTIPKLYDDYIYGFNKESQFSLYSKLGDLVYSFKEKKFNTTLEKIYFNKVFLLDNNLVLSVFDIKTQQKYYSIEGYEIEKFIISSSNLIILTQDGTIVCFDYLTGTFRWELSTLAIDNIDFFGQSGFMLASKDKQLYIISTQSAVVEEKISLNHKLDSILTATNSFAVIQAKNPYLFALQDLSLKKFKEFDINQIRHWYRKKAAVGFDESINSFFLYDFSLEDYIWFFQVDYKLDYHLFNDTHLCLFEESGNVYIVSLYDGQIVAEGTYDLDESPENFTYKDDHWYIITKSNLFLLEKNYDQQINIIIEQTDE